MIVNRACAPPDRWTFQIEPIALLVRRYVGDGIGWVDPFAGDNSPAEFTNDLNKLRRAKSHLYADEFCAGLVGRYKGILFDPPYSFRQVTDCYQDMGLKATSLDTSNAFYHKVMNAICDKIVPGGYALSFGWNSNGFGRNRGFSTIEILLVAHGDHHNDTICTVEKKINNELRV